MWPIVSTTSLLCVVLSWPWLTVASKFLKVSEKMSVSIMLRRNYSSSNR